MRGLDEERSQNFFWSFEDGLVYENCYATIDQRREACY